MLTDWGFGMEEDDDYYSQWLEAQKREMCTINVEFFLHLNIKSMRDPPSHPFGSYAVRFWVDMGMELMTQEAALDELLTHSWEVSYKIPIGDRMFGRHLFLELVRFNAEPSTSEGLATVGRVHVPLPKELEREKSGEFLLVMPGPTCKAGGVIKLRMLMSAETWME